MILRTMSLSLCILLVSAPALADGFRFVERDGRQAEYEGSLKMSGHFERRLDAETLDWRGDRICFYPDNAALAKLPNDAVAKANSSFCFSNHRTATEQLHVAVVSPTASGCGVSGTATIQVSHYIVESGGTFDQAALDRVDSLGTTTTLRCQ
jgi:hypothetical protein